MRSSTSAAASPAEHTIPSGDVRFYVDESLMGIGKAYAVLRRDLTYPGHYAIPELMPGALDDEWIPVVAGMDLIAILRDKRTRTKPPERAAIIEHGLRCVLIAVKHDLSNWGYNRLLVKHRPRIEELAQELGDGPWRISVLETIVKYERLDPPDREAAAT